MYYQRSRRKNRHQNEELKNISAPAERLPSRSQSAHLTDEQVEQVLSAIRAAKSSADISSSSRTTTTASSTTDMRSRSSSRPRPPSTPPPPLPKSKIHQDVDRDHVPKSKFDETIQMQKVKIEQPFCNMRSRSSSRPPPPSTPPPPLPKSKKSPKTI